MDAEYFGSLISKTVWCINSYFNKLIKEAELDVTPEQWGVIAVLYQSGGISQTEIALTAKKDKTNITRILDLLEKKKWIERSAALNDRRAYRVFLTKEGIGLAEKLIPIADRVQAESLAGLSEEEQKILYQNLLKIRGMIEQKLK